LTTEMLSPSLSDIEVDKMSGAWVLTWWLPDNSATLRLKVRHCSCIDPDEFVAEIKVRPDEEFRPIHEFRLSVHEITHPEEFDDVWDDMPDVWTEEFAALARMWAQLTYIAEFGPSIAQRYAGEPASSLDHFYCDADRHSGRDG
jgi:hypothetical protein